MIEGYLVAIAVALRRCTAEVLKITFPVERPKKITVDRMFELDPSRTEYAFVYCPRFKQYFIFSDSVDLGSGVRPRNEILPHRCMNIWAIVGENATVLLKRNVHIITGSPVWTSPKGCFKVFYRFLICNKEGLRSEVEDTWVEMMKTYDQFDAQEEYWERECDAMERLNDNEDEEDED